MRTKQVRQVIFYFFVLFLLSGCTGRPIAPVYDAHEYAASPPRYHKVNKGETLYSIAWYYGHDYRELARWNGIDPPYKIFPDQRISLGPVAKSSQLKSGRGGNPEVIPQSKQLTVKPKTVQENPKQSGTKIAYRKGLRWVWPTKGPVYKSFRQNADGKRGIDILGTAGTAITACADGEVVFSGSGILRYGRLIIIKHNQVYFSAYAHNRKLLVEEGDRVKSGQKIAEMGDTGTDQTMLHFEIRRNGKPVDPLDYLPKR